jgi:hypothetical protein
MFSIFKKLGGENLSLDIIAAARGKRPSADLLNKWRRERRIPPIRAVVLLDECGRRGIAASYGEDCVSPPAPEQILTEAAE